MCVELLRNDYIAFRWPTEADDHMRNGELRRSRYGRGDSRGARA